MAREQAISTKVWWFIIGAVVQDMTGDWSKVIQKDFDIILPYHGLRSWRALQCGLVKLRFCTDLTHYRSLFSSRRQLVSTRLVTASGLMKTCVVLCHSRFQDYGCRFLPSSCNETKRVWGMPPSPDSCFQDVTKSCSKEKLNENTEEKNNEDVRTTHNGQNGQVDQVKTRTGLSAAVCSLWSVYMHTYMYMCINMYIYIPKLMQTAS